jgi:small subunit ribosomal protein S20
MSPGNMNPGGSVLANHKSAIKKMRVTERRRIRNRFFISGARTKIKAARIEIASGDPEAARKATLEALRILDRAAGKGILHKNNAARRKSRLMKQLATLDAAKK